jgi:hypothetical protein
VPNTPHQHLPSLGDRVLISPRYLAGTGADSLGNVIGPLTHLFGWHTTHDPATGLVTLDSPDHCLFITFEPMRFDGVWWTIAHHEPHWEAKFTRQTPVEAIAAVAQALPQLLGDHRHSEQIFLTAGSPSSVAAGHQGTAHRDGNGFTAPDGHCTLRRTSQSPATWTVNASLYEGFDTEWSAVFTGAPERLVAQFVAGVASDIPVERAFGDIPYLVQRSSSALITPVRGAAVNPHVHHAVALAAQAHADRNPRR